MTELHPVGALLDALGVEMALGPDQHLAEVVVLAKVVDFASDDPTPALAIGSSKGLDWIARDALIDGARRILDVGGMTCACDDD